MATITLKSSIFNKGWGLRKSAFVVYLLTLCDDWGLVRENPAMFAAAVTTKDDPATAEEVTVWLNDLTSEKVLTFARYSENGTDYLATPKWQDNQQRKYFSKGGPNCPIPPLEVIRKLSEKTRANFRHCAEKLPPPIAVAVAVAVATAVDKGGEHHQECVDAYHNGYLALTKTKPVIDGGDTRLLKQRLGECGGATDEWRKVLVVIQHAVSGRDEKFRREPPALRTILSTYHFNRIQGQLSMEATR